MSGGLCPVTVVLQRKNKQVPARQKAQDCESEYFESTISFDGNIGSFKSIFWFKVSSIWLLFQKRENVYKVHFQILKLIKINYWH